MGGLVKVGVVDEGVDVDFLMDLDEILDVVDAPSLTVALPDFNGIVMQMSFAELADIIPLVLYNDSGANDGYVNAKQVTAVYQEDSDTTPVVKIRMSDGRQVTSNASLATLIGRFKHIDGSVLT